MNLPVYGADVVETATCDVAAGWGVGTGHDPAGAQRNGMHFVGGVTVPHN